MGCNRWGLDTSASTTSAQPLLENTLRPLVKTLGFIIKDTAVRTTSNMNESTFLPGPRCQLLGTEVYFNEGPNCLKDGSKCLFQKGPKCPIGAQ